MVGEIDMNLDNLINKFNLFLETEQDNEIRKYLNSYLQDYVELNEISKLQIKLENYIQKIEGGISSPNEALHLLFKSPFYNYLIDKNNSMKEREIKKIHQDIFRFLEKIQMRNKYANFNNLMDEFIDISDEIKKQKINYKKQEYSNISEFWKSNLIEISGKRFK